MQTKKRLRVGPCVSLVVLGIAVAATSAGCGSEPKVVVGSPGPGVLGGAGDNETIFTVMPTGEKCPKKAKDCFSDGNIQAALDKAVDGDTVALEDGEYSYVSTDKAPLPDPVLSIVRSITLAAADELDDLNGGEPNPDAGNCPDDEDSCPRIVVEVSGETPPRPPSTVINVTADGVTIENIWITAPDPGSTYGGQLINIPAKTPAKDTFYDDVTLTELGLQAGRRGMTLTGSDLSIVGCRFLDNAAESLVLAQGYGLTNVQSNSFVGGGSSKKAILVEARQGSPAQDGRFTIVDNVSDGKRNFFVWDSWSSLTPPASVELIINHNSIVDPGGEAVSFYLFGEAATFAQFANIEITNNIIAGAGGDAVLVDYTESSGDPPSGWIPFNGEIKISHALSHGNAETTPGESDPLGPFGFGKGKPPGGATLNMFAISSALNADPLFTGGVEDGFPLDTKKSPAEGAASDGTNIGAWQGDAPVTLKLKPRCGVPGDTRVKISGKRIGDVQSITFGGVPGTNIKQKGKNVWVDVPGTASDVGKLVDVVVVTSHGESILYDAFTYTKSRKCKDRGASDGDD